MSPRFPTRKRETKRSRRARRAKKLSSNKERKKARSKRCPTSFVCCSFASQRASFFIFFFSLRLCELLFVLFFSVRCCAVYIHCYDDDGWLAWIVSFSFQAIISLTLGSSPLYHSKKRCRAGEDSISSPNFNPPSYRIRNRRRRRRLDPTCISLIARPANHDSLERVLSLFTRTHHENTEPA